MVGFIKSLFGGKKKDEDEIVQPPKAKPEKAKAEAKARPDARQKVAKQELAYFLGADDAQGLGNVEYMRAVRTIRRTFPKTLSQPEEQEFLQEVSAWKQAIRTKGQAAITEAISTAEQASSEPTSTRRRPDSSMDMFRNMAKDINKK